MHDPNERTMSPPDACGASALLLLPASARPHGERVGEIASVTHGAMALYRIEDPRHAALRFAIVPPPSLTFDPSPYADIAPDVRVAERQAWRSEIQREPRERRREARRGTRGRRGACPVPMAERRAVDLFAEHDVPERDRRAAVETGGAPLVAVVWRCPCRIPPPGPPATRLE